MLGLVSETYALGRDSRKAQTHCTTLKATLLVRVPPGVATVIKPVVAPVGTVAAIREVETTLKTAGVPLKLTPVVPINFVPKILIPDPTLPEPGVASTN